MKIFLMILISVNAFAGMKSVMSAMHGDKMAVEYYMLNSGQHILAVKKLVKTEGNQSTFQDLQTIKLNIDQVKGEEFLSSSNGFVCIDNRNDAVYAVISKAKAKEKGNFEPERAWIVDKINTKLVPTKEITKVSCHWEPNSDAPYPFK